MLLDSAVGDLAEPVSGRRWNRIEAAREIRLRVARFRALELRRGERVFLLFGNRMEFFVELIAIWQLGGCAVPVDGRLTPFEVEILVTTAKPSMAVVDEGTDAAVTGILNAAGVRVIETTNIGCEEEVAGESRFDDDALILFTSGSTGAPKGVVHTHRSLRARWISLNDCLGLDTFARSLCLLPTHFGHGLICNCLFPWLSGQDLYITQPFRPDIIMRLGQLLDEHEITFMSSVPALWNLALKLAKPPTAGTLKRVHCGSAPLSAHMWENVRNWTGTRQVCNAYGITETGSWLAGLSDADCDAEDGLIGQGWGTIIKILKQSDATMPLDKDAECATGESGCIWLNTPALMKGYFERSDLTDKVVRDGWFVTGDIGALDARGRLVLRGRERDEINKGGMKIYPADVDAVAERFQQTSDVCTFGVEDEIYGEIVGIAVVLSKTDNATISALYAWMTKHLAESKMPTRWWIVDEIARTSRGKLNRVSVMAACKDLVPLDLAGLLDNGEWT